MIIRNRKKLPIVFVLAGILLIACGGAAFIFRDSINSVVRDIKQNNENAGKPKFVFDTAKQSGWWTTGNNWPNPDDADDGVSEDVTLPIAAISIHQCKVANKCKDPEKDTMGAHCFVMAFYQMGTIDSQTAIANTIEQNKKWGTDIQEVGVKTLSMNTPEGNKEYQFYQYDYKSKDGSGFKKGNAQGYISLSDGYIDIRSICDEASQLDETSPALEAIRLSA